MSHGNDHNDDDPIIVPPGFRGTTLLLTAIAAGVAGFLICQFLQSGNAEDPDCPPAVSAVYDDAKQARIDDAI